MSEANDTGFYGQARLDKELILSLPPDDVWVTSACIKFWDYEDVEDFVAALFGHFGRNFYLEVQYHNTESQRELNKRIIRIHRESGIPLIMGCDSHYIYPKQAQNRTDYLVSKGLTYPQEEGWYLDYPDGDEAYRRFAEQCVLSDGEIREAIENTNVFLQVEEYDSPIFNKDIKMPSLYLDKPQEERDEIYKRLIRNGFKAYSKGIPPEKRKHYIDEIAKEVQTVIDTKTADYFIINHEVIKQGKKNGGHLTKSGRGSAVSFVTNMLLGFTEVDRIAATVKMYPERFMSTERILQSGSLPDIDFNVDNQEPFALAQKQVLGDDHAYPMIAYGTAKASAAWKLYAKSQGVPFELANEVSEQIKRYETALKHADEDEKEDIDVHKYIDKQYWEVFDKSNDFRGLISSWSIAPCSYLLYQGSIREEIGLVRIKDNLCCLMDGHWAEEYHFLKNDLLTVKVVDLMYKVFDRIGIDPPSVTELLEMCPPDDPAWDVYAKGATIGINQVEKTGTTARVAKYHPTNISELCAFVAAIRPGFASMYKTFESRQPFKYGVKSFDELIQTEEMPNSFVLYQEMEMAALHYAGIPMSECYTAIKNIAKKRVEKVLSYKDKFISGFAAAIIRDEKKPEKEAEKLAGDLWTIIEDSSRYSFNACVSGDTFIMKYDSRMETVETMYKAMHDQEHPLHMEYARRGYGYGYSFGKAGLAKNKIVDIRPAGKQPVYKVTLENGHGMFIKCTGNHKFPTPSGDKQLSELSVGDELYWMSPEMVYQIKIDKASPQPLLKKIATIEKLGEELTYDVEMSDPAHNFVTATGIVTSNSHSYCVSLDSLYGAWLKAHHPVEFYEVFINQMEEKGDKDRAQDAKREAEEYFGIKFLPYRYGQDNRAPIADVEKRIITKSLTSVKGFGKTLARELYQCSKNDFKYFVDVLKWLDERSIKEAKVTPLIQIDYFQQFGNSAELSRMMRMFDFFKQGTMKTIRKEKLAGSELEHIVARHATDRNAKNEELKTYTITDVTAILHECEDYIKSLNISEINLKVKMQNQLDILGYIDIKTGVPEDRRKLIVTDLAPLKSKASGDVWGYACFTRSVGTGKNARLTIRTATYNKNKISKGDIIYASDVQKNQSGYWYLIKYERVE